MKYKKINKTKNWILQKEKTNFKPDYTTKLGKINNISDDK